MKVYERTCIQNWFIEASNGDRQECKKGSTYTTSAELEGGVVFLYSRFWVPRVPVNIFEPLPTQTVDR